MPFAIFLVTLYINNHIIMSRNIFKGLGIALITPFTQDGEVDYAALQRLIRYQLDNGADFSVSLQPLERHLVSLVMKKTR